ncbi:MAG: helix-turn-helix domain-containing protein [Thermaerobacter sp.]|nr:helix-turn-helix domain-containing protein [Thermaerobacter sp.]
MAIPSDLLCRLSQCAAGAVEPRQVLERLLPSAEEFLGGSLMVGLRREDAMFFTVGSRVAHAHPLQPPPGLSWPLTAPGRAGSPPRCAAYVPLACGSEAWGYLAWETAQEQPWDDLLALAGLLALALGYLDQSLAAREALARRRELVEDTQDMFFTIDPTGRVTSVNHQVERLLALPPAEVLDADFARLLAPSSYAAVLERLRESLARGEPSATWSAELLRHDGDTLPVELTLTTLYREGQVTAWEGRARPSGALPASPLDRQMPLLNHLPLILAGHADPAALLSAALDALDRSGLAQGYCACLASAAGCRLVAQRALPPPQREQGKCLAAYLSGRTLPLTLREPERDPRTRSLLPEIAGFAALTALPLRFGTEHLGGVCLFHRSPRPRSPDEDSFLAAMAGEIAGALERVQSQGARKAGLHGLRQALASLQAGAPGDAIAPEAILTGLSELLGPQAAMASLDGTAATRHWRDDHEALRREQENQGLPEDATWFSSPAGPFGYLPLPQEGGPTGCAWVFAPEPGPELRALLDVFLQQASYALAESTRQEEGRDRAAARVAAVHQEMVAAVLTEGVGGVVRVLAAQTGGPAVVVDAQGETLAATPWGEGPLPHLNPQEWPLDPGSSRQPGPAQTHLWAARVVAGDELLGGVAVPAPTDSARAPRTLGYAAALLPLELLRRREAEEAVERLKGDFLEELLSGDSLARGARARVRRLGYSSQGVGAVAVASGADRRGLMSALEAACRELPGSMAIAREDQVVLLLPPGDDPVTAARSLWQTAKRRYAQELSMGVGDPCQGSAGVRTSYATAREALDAFRALGGHSSVISHAELGTVGLLLHSLRPEQLREFAAQRLGPLVEYDLRHDADLLKTLQLFMEHHGQVLPTARSASIHPSTLKYRLRRIEELLKVSLQDSRQRFDLQLALQVHLLAEHYRPRSEAE